MNKLGLLGRKMHKINDHITIKIPTVEEIWGNDSNDENTIINNSVDILDASEFLSEHTKTE